MTLDKKELVISSISLLDKKTLNSSDFWVGFGFACGLCKKLGYIIDVNSDDIPSILEIVADCLELK